MSDHSGLVARLRDHQNGGRRGECEEAASAIEQQGAKIARLNKIMSSLITSIEDNGLDVSECNGCSAPIVYCGDGLPYCAECAEDGK